MKPRILFINSVCGFGSTGRIVADLSKNNDFETLVCFGRKKDYANVNSYKFANFFDNAFGALGTILFDNNLNICSLATKRLIKKIKEFNPDIIHLNNIHGYYLNVEMLFKFLKEYNKPVVWTMHDCWAITGYCPHFDAIECDKYISECNNCPHKFSYPFSILKQNIKKDYYAKKELFNSLSNLMIVTPSKWLSSIIDKSYLKNSNHITINNGINIDDFKQTVQKNNKFTVLAPASIWSQEKGIDELNKILPLLDKDIDIVVVGFGSNNVKNCISLKRTNSKKEMIDLYSSSHLTLNVSLEETFPTINIESLACGTPVITYDTGGSPEIINDKTGIIVQKYDYKEIAKQINSLKNNYFFNSQDCINKANDYTVERMINNYTKLYEGLLGL